MLDTHTHTHTQIQVFAVAFAKKTIMVVNGFAEIVLKDIDRN